MGGLIDRAKAMFGRGPAQPPDLVSQIFPTIDRLAGGIIPKEKPETRSPIAEQIELSDSEENELLLRLERDRISGVDASRDRREKFRRYEELWRNQVGAPGGTQGKPNFHYPLIQSQVLEKMAREFQTLFGSDSKVVALPTRPTDKDKVEKNSAYMKWLVFSHMPNFINRWAVFEFNRLKFGRAHALLTYRHIYLEHPTKGRVLWKKTPDFRVLDPSDVFTPGEDAETAQDFSYFLVRQFYTPEQLLRDEREGKRYFGVEKNWEEIRNAARMTSQREDERGDATQDIKWERDRAEGEDKTTKWWDSEFVEVWHWFGPWRMLKNLGAEVKDANPRSPYSGESPRGNEAADTEGKPSTGEGEKDEPGATARPEGSTVNPYAHDEEREREETELFVSYVPRIRKIIGCQKSAELYPETNWKRPIYEASLMRDGSYWGMGVFELLESLEKELTQNENLFTQGGQMSVGPIIFYRPASGANPDVLRYEPGIMIPSDNPREDIHTVMLQLNPEYFVLNAQSKQAMVERLMGSSDFSAGRNIQRPTAPRTARATMALLERGDLRVGLDMAFLLIDFANFLKMVWQLASMFAPALQFFRVTGEDAEASWADGGFGRMTTEDFGRDHKNEEGFGDEYDFEMQPATGVHAKEALKDDILQLFAISQNMPLIAMNPWAQWQLGKRVFKEFGLDWAKLVPMPQKPELSEDPRQEWLKTLQGNYDEVTVSVADDDRAHLIRHNMDIKRMYDGPEDEVDEAAMNFMIDHIEEHKQQLQAKMLQQALMQTLMNTLIATRMAGGNRFGETDDGQQPQGQQQQPGPGRQQMPKQPMVQPGLDGVGAVAQPGQAGMVT